MNAAALYLMPHPDLATCTPCAVLRAAAARWPVGTPVQRSSSGRLGQIGVCKAPLPTTSPHQLRVSDDPPVAQVIANQHGMPTVFVKWFEGTGANWVHPDSLTEASL
ncbi:hypothetical protein AB0B94_30575 [Micromonospora sp. NPDC048986]|uniref:hypothetical protein n=1 Tax=Micromonospora sp. NPDC048986 TaxID=3155644 RepID=UPI0033E50E13